MRMLAGDVLLMRLSGVLTAPVLAGFASEAAERYGHRARGFVLDYRRAVIVATVDELHELIKRTPVDSPIRRPGAFVGSQASLPALREHALQMARAGIPRKTFVDTLGAHLWVRARSA